MRTTDRIIMLLLFIVCACAHNMMLASSMILRPQHSTTRGSSTASFLHHAPIQPRISPHYHSSCYTQINYNHHNNQRSRRRILLYQSSDPSPSGEYLNHLSQDGSNSTSPSAADRLDGYDIIAAATSSTSSLNGDVDTANDLDGCVKITEESNNSWQEVPNEPEYDDDDYANSELPPVRSDKFYGVDMLNGEGGEDSGSVGMSGSRIKSSTAGGSNITDKVNGDQIAQIDEGGETAHPNEEPPIPEGGEDYEQDLLTSTIYKDALKSSKFDEQPSSVTDTTSTVAAAEEESLGVESSDESKTSNNKGIKTMLQNFLGSNDEEKTREETERRRRWSEWMKTGRKVRDTSTASSEASDSTTSADVVLDENLLSVDKGADYVVVAVPAEAADGVAPIQDLPILSSFPGGKRFQKAVRKSYQDLVVNGDSSSSGGSNTTAASSSTTTSPTISIDKKKKQKQQSRKKKKAEKQKKEEEDAEQKQRRRRDKHYREQRVREPGRISAGDWRHNIHNIFTSTILRDVRNPVAYVFAWATLWSVVHKWLTRLVSTAAKTASLESGGAVVMGSGITSVALSPRSVRVAAWFARHMCLPTVQHTMMISAMSLLLVFRTNSAYQRFVEGRKIWNDIVDSSRDFSRMIKLYEFAIGTSKCRRINSLLAAFPYLLRHRIRPSLMSFYSMKDGNVERDPENSLLIYPDESLRDTDPEVGALAALETGSSRRKTRELCWVDKRTLPWKLIPGSALELCARAQNRPLWVCDRMAKELAVVDDMLPKFTNRERLALIGYVDKLSRSIGACERIHQTVVPLNYARHALRSLTVWLWTLPFALVKDLGLFTGPAIAVVSWILFGVYEIGTRIEDPFQGTLRLSIYCDAIRRDVLADAIARDTAFDLDEEGKSVSNEDGDYDAIFELESESEEYENGEDTSPKKKRRKSLLDLFE